MDLNQSLEQLKEKALATTQRLTSTDAEVRALAAQEILDIVQDLQEFAGNELLTVLAAKLNDPDEEVRVRIVEALGYIRNPRILPVLRQLLGKDVKPVKLAVLKALGEMKLKGPVETLVTVVTKVNDDELIAEAVRALEKIKDRRTIPVLKNLLIHDNHDIVFAAVRGLCVMGEEEGIRFLEECLTSSQDFVKAEAARLLADFGDPSHVQGLIQLLFDTSARVRLNAIHALGKIEADKAAPLLKTALGDSEPAIRASAAEALGNCGDESLVPALCELLEDSHPDPKRCAAEALGKLKDPSAVAYLIVLLGDEDDRVRVAACNSLMSLAFWLEDLEAKNRLSIALVISLEDALEPVRAAAAETLGYLGLVDDEGLEALHTRLKDTSSAVIIAACAALGSIADPRSADELKQLLASPDPLVRWNAVTSLGKLSFADKPQVLRKMMRDEDETVREAAKAALSF